MVQITEQLAALGKSQLEALLRTATLAADNAGKLADLQLKASKAAYEDGVKALRQIAAARDVAEAATSITSSAQPAWDRTAAYARSTYEVITAGQAEYRALLEEQFAELNRNVVLTLDAALKSAPAGSEGAVSAVKSAVHSANTVYESLITAAKQVSSIAEANMAAVGAQVATASRKKATA
jgi:phasin family protein